MAVLQRAAPPPADIVIDNVPSGAAITMPMFCDQEPFNDVNVRMALKLAIDREDIIKKIAFGTAIGLVFANRIVTFIHTPLQQAIQDFYVAQVKRLDVDLRILREIGVRSLPGETGFRCLTDHHTADKQEQNAQETDCRVQR